MSQIVLKDCFVLIDDVEYSGNTTNVAISMSSDAEDVTPMQSGPNATRMHIPGGLLDWSVALELNADESVTGQSFFDMLGATGAVEIEIRPTSGARSTSNPAYCGSAVLTEYTPLSGAVGDAHKVQLSFVSAGPLSRLTTAS